MNLFNIFSNRAELLEEARTSKFEDIFQFNRLQKTIAEKQLGLPRPLSFRFILQFLQDKKIVPKHVRFEGSQRYAADVGELVTSLFNKDYVSDEKKADLKKQFADYLDENLPEFIGRMQVIKSTRSLPGGRSKGEMVNKQFGSTEESEKYRQIKSKEEFDQYLADEKRRKQEDKSYDETKVTLAELKTLLMKKLSTPYLLDKLKDDLLNYDIDDPYEAEELADRAIETITSNILKANSVDMMFDSLERSIDKGDAAETVLGQVMFNIIKRVIPAYDDRELPPTAMQPSAEKPATPPPVEKQPHDSLEMRRIAQLDREVGEDDVAPTPYEYKPPTPAPVAKKKEKKPYEDLSPEERIRMLDADVDEEERDEDDECGCTKKKKRRLAVYESTRSKFKPKNIHQLIQLQQERYLY